MQIAVLTFDRFNELDSFVVANLLNRLEGRGWRAWITAPEDRVVSRNGVVVEAQRPLEFTAEADAVIVGSGRSSKLVLEDPAIMGRIALDPSRQLVASQCSGALMLAHLGLLPDRACCTDSMTRPLLEARGVTVLDRTFGAWGNVATAGGCLSSPAIAAWMIGRRLGLDAAAEVIRSAAPVGEAEAFTGGILGLVAPHLGDRSEAAA